MFTKQMIDTIYAAWHGAGVDIAGGSWARFVGMLPLQKETEMTQLIARMLGTKLSKLSDGRYELQFPHWPRAKVTNVTHIQFSLSEEDEQKILNAEYPVIEAVQIIDKTEE